jgi:hypothetical protein
MARIVLSGYMVRFPTGGIMSWVLQYLVGFQRLGHEIYLVEKAGYPDSCFDPEKMNRSNDCGYGVRTVNALLERYDLGNRWCYVDALDRYYGLTREQIQAVFDSADLFIDMGGTYGTWLEEATNTGVRILLEGDPGFTQMRMEKKRVAGDELPVYDYYYTIGRNIGTAGSTVPTAGKQWRWHVTPVVIDLFRVESVNLEAPYTTVMNWDTFKPVKYEGKTYGSKDVEFRKFENLPRLTSAPLELAVSGKRVPTEQLARAGWRVRNACDIAKSVDSYTEYIRGSKGEFTVCRNGYVATRSGWFGERAIAYLASGRPVVMQDTGWSDHVPCGEGIFAVRTVEEAAAAIDEIERDYARHSKAARQIAEAHFDTAGILPKFLDELGL